MSKVNLCPRSIFTVLHICQELMFLSGFTGAILEQKMNKCTKSTTFLFAEHFPYSLVSLEEALGQCGMEG